MQSGGEGGDYIFKPAVPNDCLQQDVNGNGVRIVKFATSKNLVVKITMFLHQNIHKYTLTSLGGKTHNQIDHVLIERRWIRVYMMCEVSRELTVILITIWWLQKLGTDYTDRQKFCPMRKNICFWCIFGR